MKKCMYKANGEIVCDSNHHVRSTEHFTSDMSAVSTRDGIMKTWNAQFMMMPGDKMYSPNNILYLEFNQDGLIYIKSASDNSALWSNSKELYRSVRKPLFAVMQGDGNFVTYDIGDESIPSWWGPDVQPYWSTKSGTTKVFYDNPPFVQLTDAGEFKVIHNTDQVVYSRKAYYLCKKSALWCTHKGSTYKKVDCLGSGIEGDHICTDVGGSKGTIMRINNCVDTWPNAPIGSCPAGGL